MEQPTPQALEGPARAAGPPAGSGIDLAWDDAGLRIILPRRITAADVGGTAAAGLTAIWIGAGVIVAAAGDAQLPPAGLLLFVLVGLGFAALTGVMARALATPRVIEDRGDALHLCRLFCGRRTNRITVPKHRIRSVDRRHRHGEAGPIRIHTDTAVHRIGARLERHEQEWLEAVIRGMVNGPRPLGRS